MMRITYREFENLLRGARVFDAHHNWLRNEEYVFACFAFDDNGAQYVEPENRGPAVDERLALYRRHPGWYEGKAMVIQ